MTPAEGRVGVLCLGASAGGLRSLQAVLAKLPASFPWPVLISQHLQREHVSLMPEILSRATSLPVREAVDGVAPQPGVAYTCPSSAELGLSPEGRLTLRAPVEGRPQRIDHLFSSASFARPGLVIAVILSGTGTDGAAGSLVVKLNGGTVLVESEESAQESAMPQAAIRAGTVDAARPADELGPLLVELAEGGLEETTQATARDVAAIARTLSEGSGTDFTRYRPGTLRRRIKKRLAIAGLATLADYHALLRRDAPERAALTRSLLLPVTEFFRDPEAWQVLGERVAPPLAERAREGALVRVWSAGCATGEEAYSLAMALAEAGVPLEQVEVLATDLDEESLSRGRAGVYDAARLANVDAARRARFLVAEGDGFRVQDALRAAVTFRAHDLTRDPLPQGPFDVIACRNVLIYFDDAMQAGLLRGFEERLAPMGALFLGKSAPIPPRDAFEPIARPMRLFRARRSTPAEGSGDARPRRPPQARDAVHAVDAVLVEDSTAVILVMDPAWRIRLANRRARESLAPDVVGRSLLAVFPRWRGSAVHRALRGVLETGRSVRVQGVPMGSGFVDLTVEALPDAGERRLILVASPAAGAAPPGFGSDLDDQRRLREDLAATNDELQTANEELAAANEELQATNEELASLNEEFLSTNQNLSSSNAEMSASIEHARPSSDLLRAIILARDDAALACDAEGRVTLVTPRAGRLLGLDGAAVGKPVASLDFGLAPGVLAAWLDAAAGSMAASRHALAHGGSLRIDPIAGPDGARLGWLLTWADPRGPDS